MFYSRNPYTGVLREEFPPISLQEAEDQLRRCSKSQEKWQTSTLTERGRVLRKLDKILGQHREELALMAASEMGKPLDQGLAEVDKCAWLCRVIADQGPSWLLPSRTEEKTMDVTVHYRPVGVVLGIMPWNYPYWQILRFAIPTLYAGNAVLIKPAPQLPGCTQSLIRLMALATGESDLTQPLFLDVDQLDPFLSTGLINGVSLTGSDQAGRSLAALAGRYLIPAVLELGGSDPFIVAADADLDKALQTAVLSRMTNNGQTCLAAKRFIIHESVHEAFLAGFKTQLAVLPAGDPRQTGVFFSCMARPDLAASVGRQVQASLSQGADLYVEMDRASFPQETGFPPSILHGVSPGMPAWDEEVFGPVAVVTTFRSEDEMVRLANHSPYGLGASLWTRDRHLAERWSRVIQAGTLAINTIVRSDPRFPFGGIKASGHGRELGKEGIRAFTNVQTQFFEEKP